MNLLILVLFVNLVHGGRSGGGNDSGDLQFDEEGNMLPAQKDSKVEKVKKPLNFLRLVASKVKAKENEDLHEKVDKVRPLRDIMKDMTIDDDDKVHGSKVKAVAAVEEEMDSAPASILKDVIPDDDQEHLNADAKAELKTLRHLHDQLVESKDPENKAKLRKEIMEKVDELEHILHMKGKNTTDANAGEASTDDTADDYFQPSGQDGQEIVMPPITTVEPSKVNNETDFEPLIEFNVDNSTAIEASANATAGTTGSLDMEPEEPEVAFYPWERPICEDADERACQAFKPFCHIMAISAYRKCRKTCKLCIKDKPSPKGLYKGPGPPPPSVALG
jgi:hypothetical protein